MISPQSKGDVPKVEQEYGCIDSEGYADDGAQGYKEVICQYGLFLRQSNSHVEQLVGKTKELVFDKLFGCGFSSKD